GPSTADAPSTADPADAAGAVGSPSTADDPSTADPADAGKESESEPSGDGDAGGRSDDDEDEGEPVDPDGAVGPEIPAEGVVNEEPPLLGDAFVFRALEVTAGVWLSGADLTRSYQWQRCVEAECQDIPGATGKSYTPAIADLGAPLKVVEKVARTDESTDESVSAVSNETDEVTCAQPLASEPLGAASASNVASGVEWTFTAGDFPAIAEGDRSGQAQRAVRLARVRLL